ncbi:RING finger and WD repeat domain-containing protein 3 [Kickxella alabastrina]|uniref:RING finger and WD repeat domain-containing protein 3 n=1 Tax=Kickxella alabastrina TaxID=61397 RepID=A0ACC1IWB8_9FUNG|nr:RING finger and WD repeat domain-containing protein 3 [Kickxella alabastrina]
MQGCGSDESSDDAHEFQQQRSAVAMEPPASDACGFFPAVVPPAPAAADGDESSTCSICLDGWGISGAHRVVSLKCGHLFGLSCVRKWLLRGNGRQKTQKGRCPECNQPAATRDIRALFARSIRALDDSGQQELQREIKRLASRTCELESELQHYQVLYAQMRNEAMRARTVAEDTYRRLQWLEAENAARGQTAQGIAGESAAEPAAEPLPVVLRLRATVPLATAPGESARILALDPHEPLVYASFSRPGHLHTMAVVSAHDAHTASGSARTLLPPLHSEEIRGAEVSPHTAGTRYLLTASMDQTVALTTLACDQRRCAPRVAARFAAGAPAWSCAWDPADPNRFYAGAAFGRVLAFDVRRMDAPVATWAGAQPVGSSPIHAIACVRGRSGTTRLIVANAQHLYALPETAGAPWLRLTAPGAEPRSCLSLSYDAPSSTLAASFRAPGRSTVHELYDVAEAPAGAQGAQGLLVAQGRREARVASPQGRWARSCVASLGSGPRHVLFSAAVEAERCVRVWDARLRIVAGALEVPSPEIVVDVRGGRWDADGLSLLVSLTDRTLRLYDVR